MAVAQLLADRPHLRSQGFALVRMYLRWQKSGRLRQGSEKIGISYHSATARDALHDTFIQGRGRFKG
jgi:hypothetical protein